MNKTPAAQEIQIGLLFDATRCIGCGACAVACRADHQLPESDPGELNAYTYTTVQERGGQYMRRLCMHCLTPTCVSVCPVAALKQEPGGQVTYDADACMGCRYCVFACPFNVPRYEWSRPFPKVTKCDFCVGRTSRGGETACAWVCPVGATLSGTRAELLALARERIRREPGRYVDHVYGETEAGGTSVLLLSGIPFEAAGYTAHIQTRALPELTWQVLKKLPYVCVNAAIVLGGLSWVVHRRMEMERHPERLHDRPPSDAGEKGNHGGA